MRAAVILAGWLAAPSSSYAAPPSPSAPAASSSAPVPLTLTVTPAAAGAQWKVRIENTGSAPARIPADARLLTLEIAPPGAGTDAKPAARRANTPTTVRCTLPDDVRPSNDDSAVLVVPPGRAWSAMFDPLFYCFGARERTALVPGAHVTAHFGWPARATAPSLRARSTPPFAAAPIGSDAFVPAKELTSATFDLGPEMAPAEAVSKPSAPSAPSPSDADTGASPVKLSMPAAAVDVGRGVDVTTNVTLTNTGARPVVVLFRASVLTFEVEGPSGTVTCGASRVSDTPIRELYTTLGPRGRSDVSVLVSGICPPDTFDQPGVYRVRPRLDTRAVSGRTLGLATWDGVVTGDTPLLVRVRAPRHPTEAPRPRLD